MPKKPVDPALQTIHKSRRKGNKFRGQQGYGVRYVRGRFQGEHLHNIQGQERSGSYEAHNTGGYGGMGQLGAGEQEYTDQRLRSPAAEEDIGGRSKDNYDPNDRNN